MPDIYLTIADQPDSVLDAIASSMADRVSDSSMQTICAQYMAALPRHAEIVEIGCGNGASTGLLFDHAAPSRLTGIDPSEGLLARARRAFADRETVRFVAGTAGDTGLADASADVVVAHTVYSHLADPAGALAEAVRILRPGGTLAICDGDFATTTVALCEGDPLQAAMQATMRNLVHDPYIMRHLPAMMQAAGLGSPESRAFGFVQTRDPAYMLSLMARGVDAAAAAGECGSGLAAAFKTEAASRAGQGCFYGAILFVCHTARKLQ